VEYSYSNAKNRKKFPWLRKHEYDSSDKLLLENFEANRKLGSRAVLLFCYVLTERLKLCQYEFVYFGSTNMI
jgi:hypothetical protein